jgi:hypothetical protein
MLPHAPGRHTAMQPHIAASLSAFASRFAATADLPFWEPRPRNPGSIPRQSRPSPPQSRQYAGAMATTAARDQRLGRAAVALAVLLVAQAGGRGHADVTRTYLARTLGYSGRTVARGLAELRACGYVRTEHRLGQLGQTVGLRCQLRPALLPFWEVGVTELAWQPNALQNLKPKSLQEVSCWPAPRSTRPPHRTPPPSPARSR